MANNIYIGVNSLTKQTKKIYVGVNGQTKKVKKVYVGINGQTKLAWKAGHSSTWVPMQQEGPLQSFYGVDTQYNPYDKRIQYSSGSTHFYLDGNRQISYSDGFDGLSDFNGENIQHKEQGLRPFNTNFSSIRSVYYSDSIEEEQRILTITQKREYLQMHAGQSDNEPIQGRNIQIDENNDIYYSNGGTQKKLNYNTQEDVSQTGISAFEGKDIQKDKNGNIWLGTLQKPAKKYGNEQRVQTSLDDSQERKKGEYIQTDGDNIYSSLGGSQQYVLNEQTEKQETKVQNGKNNIYGDGIQTDGNNIYYSYGDNNQYILT